jgi:DNA polymerase-3 subunit chi
MTSVDFYILRESSRMDRLQLTCRLVEKAFRAGKRICINTASEAEARTLDEMLWTFSEKSFLPHDLADTGDSELSPVKIFSGLGDTDEHEVLINLAEEVPVCFSQFERLLEPVDQVPQNLENGRKRYRYYRDCGYDINNHEIE